MAKIYSKRELLEAIKKIDKKKGKAICLECGDVCEASGCCRNTRTRWDKE